MSRRSLLIYSIGMIQEGVEQAQVGRTISVDDVVAEFKRDGLLSIDFSLDSGDEAQATA